MQALADCYELGVRVEVLPSVRERRSIISGIDEVFIAENNGDDLVSIFI